MKRIKFSLTALIITFILLGAHQTTAQNTFFKSDIHGKGQSLIFIPGLGCSGEVWSEMVRNLENNYECHVLTLPGFADHSAVDFEGSFTDLVVEELNNYIKLNELQNPILIGHSLGGFVSLNFTLKYPDIPQKLVIVDALPFLGGVTDPDIDKKQLEQMVNQMTTGQQNMSEEQFESMQRMMLASMITDSSDIETALEWSMNSDGKTVMQAMRDIYLTDLRDEMSQIDVPTIVLGAWAAYKNYGMTREMIRTNFENQYKNLKGVEIVLSDNGRHFLMWDDPDWTLKNIQEFVSQ